MDSSGWNFLLVALLGGLLGLCELMSRYRDEPARAIWNLPAGIYIGINAAAAATALWLINIWHPTFGFNTATQKSQITVASILVAGLGAMAFFRSSIFVFRIGDKDVPLGPSMVMQVLLDVTDRAVDRGRAEPRGLLVSRVMQGVDFDKAALTLPPYCFTLMQNVTQDEQAAIGRQVMSLRSSTMVPEVKPLLLGLVLLTIVGEEVLEAAVTTLKPYLTGGAATPTPTPSPTPTPTQASTPDPNPNTNADTYTNADIAHCTHRGGVHGVVPSADQEYFRPVLGWL
jgi:hypothetical protein